MAKVEDERFAGCKMHKLNMETYESTVREVWKNPNYSNEEKGERVELEQLLVVFRANKYIPVLMSKQQKKRLEELVNRYNDPAKLKEGLLEKVDSLFSNVILAGLGQLKDKKSYWHTETEKSINEINAKLLKELQGDKGERDCLASHLDPGKEIESDHSVKNKQREIVAEQQEPEKQRFF